MPIQNIGTDVMRAYFEGLAQAQAARRQQFTEEQLSIENKQKDDARKEQSRQFNEQLKRLTEQFKTEQELKQAEHSLLTQQLKNKMAELATEKNIKFGPETHVPIPQDNGFIDNLNQGNFGQLYENQQDLGPLGTIRVPTPESQAAFINKTQVDPKIRQAVETFNQTAPSRAALAMLPIQAAEQRLKDTQAFTAKENESNRQNARDIAASNNAARISAAAVGRQGQSNPQVQRIVTQHDANPLTKRFVTINEGVQFVNSMPNNSQNPADDQGLIYAFAKAMDPESVVREGEYKTVQQYSQNWQQRFGVNLARVVDNGGLLTPDARRKLKQTILEKGKAIGKMYGDYRTGIIERINRIAPGQADAALGSFLAEGSTPTDKPNTKSMIQLDDGSLIPDTPENRKKHGL